MFVLISVVLSIAVLAVMLYFSKKRQSTLERKFETLVLLRQVMLLSRKHRSATHLALTKEVTDSELEEIEALYEQMVDITNGLVANAPFDNKPMYRIFQLKLKGMHKEWQDRTVIRNQVIHGKTIRHCMFLMDEVAIAWLIESEREDLSDEYHMNWQQILDSMEVLTQLRLCIPEIDTIDGRLRVKYYCDKTRRKLNQLSIISPLSVASPASSAAMRDLTEIAISEELDWTEEALYELTSDVSAVISQVYDQVLSDMTETLYLPLPRVAIA